MNIIIAGCGRVGYALAQQLNEEGHEITLIDNSADRLQPALSNLDLQGVVGNASSFFTLQEADIKHADLLIAVTNQDEINLISCLLAKKASKCRTIARVRNPEYFTKQNTDKFLHQLLDAVACLHSHQVLHLDQKPDNVLLTRINSDVKLIDLGCCYTDTFADTQGRTNAYAAPEQLSGGSVDERTDIYAIGKILERLPHHDINNKVIARCTASLPEERYQSVRELQDALFRRSRCWTWLYIAILLIAFLTGFCLYTYRKPSSTGKKELPTDIRSEQPESERMIEATRHASWKEEKQEKPASEVIPTNSVTLGPVKTELSEEEKEFLNQPQLRTADSDEFARYKQKLDEYYGEANAFLNDSSNFQKYPSHNAYLSHYQVIIHKTLQRINSDDWFRPLYESSMNPVSSYTQKYKADMEHRAFVNSNKLP